jgi:nucleotide-binding universal stress UspA family protein
LERLYGVAYSDFEFHTMLVKSHFCLFFPTFCPVLRKKLVSFRKILVAVDESSQALMMFEQALELAKKESASLMVFHCIKLVARHTYLTELEVKTEQAQKLLQIYQQKAKDQGILAEFSYRTGEPGASICDLAQSWGADLVVVGRRGFKGLAEVLLGSVSNHVVHHAPCSVLVIQEAALQ